MSEAESRFTLTRSELIHAVKMAASAIAQDSREPVKPAERKQFDADCSQLARAILAQLGVR